MPVEIDAPPIVTKPAPIRTVWGAPKNQCKGAESQRFPYDLSEPIRLCVKT